MLTASEKAAAERWLGSMTDAQVQAVEDRLPALGHVAVVAFEALSTAYADMVRKPGELRLEGDMRINWSGTKKDLLGWMGSCLEHIAAQGWNLNNEACELVAGGRAQLGEKRVSATKYRSLNPRP